MWVPGGAIALVAIAVGALPWLWANFHTHFDSLNGATFNVRSRPLDFGGRLNSFFSLVFPTELGVRRGNDLAWIASGLGQPVVKVLTTVLVALVIVSLLLCLARPGRAMAIGAAVLAFPLVYAISPASTQFANGRYGVFLPPLLAMAVVIGLCEAARRLAGRGPVRQPAGGPVQPAVGEGRTSSGTAVVTVMAGIVLVALLFSVVTFSQATGQPHAFTRVWGNPDRTSLEAVTRLEKSGVTTGYADYWVAYKLDFLSQNRLTITPIGQDVIRSAAIENDVLASKRPAWLFVPPNEANRGASQFSAPRVDDRAGRRPPVILRGHVGPSQRALPGHPHRIVQCRGAGPPGHARPGRDARSTDVGRSGVAVGSPVTPVASARQPDASLASEMLLTVMVPVPRNCTRTATSSSLVTTN